MRILLLHFLLSWLFVDFLWGFFLFRSDSPAELELIRQEALAAGADAAVVSNHWAKGGAGAVNLAKAVIQVCEGESNFKFLYDLDKSIEEKITIISKEIYGADGIELSELAQKQVDTYTKQGYGNLPSTLCVFVLWNLF